MTVLVTGAHGQLGREMVRAFARFWSVVALTRHDLDITDHEEVLRAVGGASPDVIVNCAAYNNVDGAEDEPVTAMQVNGFAVCSLAEAARRTGARLVHYSTDFVFDGRSARAYEETAVPGPQSVYATSKLLGEWFARRAPSWLVLRVESLFGGGAEQVVAGSRPLGSTLDRMVDAMLAGRPVKVFTDRIVSPSYVPDVAAATVALVSRIADDGLFHCVNTGHASWFTVAQRAARRLGRESQLSPITLDTVTARAARPQFCALSNRKLARAGVEMPAWEDALDRYLQSRI